MTKKHFATYPKYKGSGVGWLGKVPELWLVNRLKYYVRLLTGGTPDTGTEVYWSTGDDGIPWVTIADMTSGHVISHTEKRLTVEGIESKGLRVLPSGTLLYSIYASLGKVAILSITASVNQAILGIVPNQKVIDRDFLRWWLEFMEMHITMLSSSNTQDNLNAEKVRNMPVFLPSISEQTAISAFLDRETSRIDALVAKKKRLIELLREQRTAIITRAITKGLDPTVPMKDPGLDWLGEVPAHWQEYRMAYLGNMSSGSTPDKDDLRFWGGDMPWVSPKDMKNRIISDSTDHITDEALVQTGVTVFEPPVVLFVVRGMILAHTFPVALTVKPVTINQDMKALTLIEAVDPSFFTYFLEGVYEYILSLVEPSSHGTRRLPTSSLRAINLLLPPTAEQRLIASNLDRNTSSLNRVIDEIRESIVLLEEQRTALVSAAVTGKIDVRKEVA